mgnify:CR=1 FL=1
MTQLSRRQWLGAAAAPLFGGSASRPNIIFLFSDDHHYRCLGAAGNPHIRTPNLDRLAGGGVQFTQGMISTPQCAPSRGVMLSGLESYQSGLESNGRTAFREGFGPTIVEQLRRAGYETTLIGKWHIQPEPDTCGFTRAPLWLRGGGSRYRNPLLRQGLGGKDEEVAGHVTDLFTDTAIGSIRGAKQPFLLWLAYNAPHTPWYADAKYRRRYEGRNDRIAPPGHPRNSVTFDWETYYAVITHLDEAIGRLAAAVEKAGLWKNTLIVFLGDNGYLCGVKGLQGKVHPWEASIRVPFFACGGAVLGRGKIGAPVASVDLPATFLDCAGVEAAYRLAGRSLRPELDKGRSQREAAFAVWNDGRPEGLATRRAVEPYRLVRTATHKYILWESKREALFDLRADPNEENNLAGDPAAAKPLADLRARLAVRMDETADPARIWSRA